MCFILLYYILYTVLFIIIYQLLFISIIIIINYGTVEIPRLEYPSLLRRIIARRSAQKQEMPLAMDWLSPAEFLVCMA